MAAVKRKQDEKHLKMLRDMAALPHNKQCFDCHQRGPTYINMTIGSFVCTSCSGILRGINPPHRVKSISMASFTPEEIEFVKCHCNDFCRKVWLGLYDSRTGMPEPDSREEQKVKDFMVQKYERKRWYVAPTDTMKEEAKRINEAATNKQPSTRPLKSLLGENAPRLVVKEEQSPQQTPKSQFPVQSTPASQPVTQSSPQSFPSPGQQSQSSQSKASATMDLLGDLGGDPFAASTPGPPSSFGGGGGSGDNFADFSNFNQFPAPASSQQPFQAFQTPSNPLVPLGTAPSQTPVSVPNGGFTGTNSTQGPSVFSAPAPSGGDKYSALSDLFSDSSSGQTESGSVSWSGGNSGTGMSWTGGSSTNSTTGVDWNSSGNSSNVGVNWNSTGSTSTPSTMGMNWNSPVGSQSSGFTSSGGNMFGGSVVSSQSAAGGMSGSNPFGSVTAPPPSFGGKTMFSAGAPGQIQVQGSFGQPNPASGGFGQPNPASGGFGQPNPVSGGFGQPNPASGGFGQPNPASGGFGQPNPASGGFGQPTSQSTFGQPVSSGQSALNTAFGGTTGFGGSAGVGMGVNPSPALSQFGMSNGNSSFNSMGPINSSAGFGAFSQPQTVPSYGIQMTTPSGQFGNKFGATDAQMQGFPGDWGQVQGQVPTANPFMSAASQPVAPKGGSTNPFL